MARLFKPFSASAPQRASVRSASSPLDRVGLSIATLTTSALLVSPAFAGVEFSNIKTGATVSSPVHVDMSVSGMEVKPAAEGVIPNTGHFHVILDGPSPAEGEAIPFDASHQHYGKGQTAADISLEPGTHTLTLQFANALHQSYGSAYASSVTVTVK